WASKIRTDVRNRRRHSHQSRRWRSRGRVRRQVAPVRPRTAGGLDFQRNDARPLRKSARNPLTRKGFPLCSGPRWRVAESGADLLLWAPSVARREPGASGSTRLIDPHLLKSLLVDFPERLEWTY